MKRIQYLIIGNLGYKSNSINGQSIKTRCIKDFFSQRFKTDYFDTDDITVLNIFRLFYNISISNRIILLLNVNGLKILMPFVFFWAKMCKCKIYLIAIGSWLPEYTKTYFGLSYLLKRFDKILVQSTQMVDALSKQNFQNVSYLFNFKEHNFERKDNFEKANRSELKIIFLSRVIWEKGLDVISFLAEQINTKKSPYLIDIYGPVDKQNSEEILQMIDSHECLEYRGIAPPETVHQIMSEYDVFLFPTRWHGEGFPGVILDAFIAGIPIIASDWRFNAELVTDDVGMIFKFGKEYEILSFLDRIYTNPDFLKKLKMNSYNKRDLYSDRTAEEILKTEGLIDD